MRSPALSSPYIRVEIALVSPARQAFTTWGIKLPVVQVRPNDQSRTDNPVLSPAQAERTVKRP
jgi:hypothetical protein